MVPINYESEWDYRCADSEVESTTMVLWKIKGPKKDAAKFKAANAERVKRFRMRERVFKIRWPLQ